MKSYADNFCILRLLNFSFLKFYNSQKIISYYEHHYVETDTNLAAKWADFLKMLISLTNSLIIHFFMYKK